MRIKFSKKVNKFCDQNTISDQITVKENWNSTVNSKQSQHSPVNNITIHQKTEQISSDPIFPSSLNLPLYFGQFFTSFP